MLSCVGLLPHCCQTFYASTFINLALFQEVIFRAGRRCPPSMSCILCWLEICAHRVFKPRLAGRTQFSHPDLSPASLRRITYQSTRLH